MQLISTRSSSKTLCTLDSQEGLTNCHGLENPLRLGQQLLLSTSTSNPGPIRANQTMLTKLLPRQVLIQTCPLQYEKPRYFHIVDATLALTQCLICHRFFEQEEWDLASLEQGACPFCGTSPSAHVGVTTEHSEKTLLEQTDETVPPILRVPCAKNLSNPGKSTARKSEIDTHHQVQESLQDSNSTKSEKEGIGREREYPTLYSMSKPKFERLDRTMIPVSRIV